MHVITRKRLNDFAKKHPDALTALAHWYRLMKRGHFFHSLICAKLSRCRSRGQAYRLQYWRNKVRLIAALHYNRRKVYIRAVLTHAEYDTGAWKE